MNIIERNNVKIRGAGKQTLILAHGYGCDQNIWQRIIPELEENYELLLFDHVGAGQSDLSRYSRSKYGTLHGYADDLIEIAQRLEIRPGIFIGHSVSAIIGLLAALKAPEHFSKLILIAPSPCYYNEGDYEGGFSYQDICEMLKGMESNYESWARAMAPVIMGTPDKPELGEELTRIFCGNKPEIAKHFAQVTFLSDHRHDVQDFDLPTLILQCTEDKIAPESVGRFLQQSMRKAELHMLKAQGHCPHVSAPMETAAAIRKYLNKSS